MTNVFIDFLTMYTLVHDLTLSGALFQICDASFMNVFLQVADIPTSFRNGELFERVFATSLDLSLISSF